MTPAGKYSLTITQKKKYNIPAVAESYTFIWGNINEDQCPEIISFLAKDGFKVVEQRLADTKEGTKDFIAIAFRA